jgi:DNA polymerase III sliding clamp (beta) subunit (PCNA family)
MSGQFPNYEAVLPQSSSILLTLDAAGFREALARVSLLAPEQSHGVCLALERGQLTLSTAGGDAGEAVSQWMPPTAVSRCALCSTADSFSTSFEPVT